MKPGGRGPAKTPEAKARQIAHLQHGLTPEQLANRPNTQGRHPKLFIEDCRSRCGKPLVDKMEDIMLHSDDDRAAIAAATFLKESGYGKATQPIVETQGEDLPHDIRIIVEAAKEDPKP